MSEPVTAIINATSHCDKGQQELAALEGHELDISTLKQPTLAEKEAADVGKPDTTDAPTARGSASPTTTADNEKAKDEEAGRPSHGMSGEKAQADNAEPPDPNILDWDGPDDPNNPVNWKSSLKWANIVTVSAITFIT